MFRLRGICSCPPCRWPACNLRELTGSHYLLTLTIMPGCSSPPIWTHARASLLTRRVLAITDHSERRLVLAVGCFGRAKPDRLEFLPIEFDRSARELSRENFARSVRRLCQHEFPEG